MRLWDRSVDLDTGDVSSGDRLTQFECAVVRHLASLGGATASRDELLVEVWGYPKPVPSRAVDTAIRRLRRKLEADPRAPRHLLTVQGEGYRWVGPPDDADAPAWARRRREAEALYGRPLSLLDPEVGVATEVRAHWEQTVDGLDRNARALVERLALTPATPAELGSALAPSVPPLVSQGLVAVRDGVVVLVAPWPEVATPGPDARAWAVACHRQRLLDDGAEVPEAIEAMIGWTDVDPTERAQLWLAAEPRSRRQPGYGARVERVVGTLLEEGLTGDPRAELLAMRGNILRAAGLLDQGLADAEAAAGHARSDAVRGRALGVQALILHTRSQWAEAAVAYRASVAASSAERPWFAAAMQAELGLTAFTLGQIDEALASVHRADALARRVLVGSPHHGLAMASVARASRVHATVLVGLGRLEEALPRLRRVIDEAPAEGSPGIAALAALTLFNGHIDRGDLDGARTWLGRAQDIVDGCGERIMGALVDGAWGTWHAVSGDAAAARSALERCIHVMADAGMPERTIPSRCWLAVLDEEAGHPEQARRRFDVALSLRPDTASPGLDGVLGSTAERLGCRGPAVPPESQLQAYVRMARRRFGLPVAEGPWTPPTTGAPTA